MKIKRMFFLLLFILLIITGLNCKASDLNITLINKNTYVELVNPLITQNGDYYISVEDLNEINLGYRYTENTCYIVYRVNCSKSRDMLEIDFSDVVISNGIHYLSLNTLASEYSDIYSIDYKNNTLSLWINDYRIETYTVSISVGDNIKIPSDGLDVTVYYGTKSNISGGTSSVLKRENSENVGFEGTSIKMPEATDILKINNINIKNEKSITLLPETQTINVPFDITVRTKTGQTSSGGGVGSTPYVGYYIADKGHTGGAQTLFDIDNKTIPLEIKTIYKQSCFYGTVSVPECSEDVSFEIYAEGNVNYSYNSNGSYLSKPEKVFLTEGTIYSGETEADYKLDVISNLDYKLTIVFPNNEYLRQTVNVTASDGDFLHNFDNLQPANILTGSVKLPDEITEYIDYISDTSLDEIEGVITLQQAEAPYYILDSAKFSIDTSTKSTEFSLCDSVGVDNVVVYYLLHDYVKDIYHEGIYKDNTSTTSNNKGMRKISPNSKNVVLNIQPAKTISVVLNCTSIIPEPELNATGHSLTEEGYVSINTIGDFNAVSDTQYRGNFMFMLPNECNRYSLNFCNDGYSMFYSVVNDICVNNTIPSDIYDADDVSKTIYCDNSGKENFVKTKITNVLDGYVHIYLKNETDNYYIGLKCFMVFYNDSGDIMDLLINSYDLDAYTNMDCQIDADDKVLNEAAYCKMFIWDTNLIPVSTEKTKSLEENK